MVGMQKILVSLIVYMIQARKVNGCLIITFLCEEGGEELQQGLMLKR